jgi:hypothetical protein
VTEHEQPPEQAADDVTVGAWLDTDPPAAVDPTSVVREPVETPGLWARLKRALSAKS